MHLSVIFFVFIFLGVHNPLSYPTSLLCSLFCRGWGVYFPSFSHSQLQYVFFPNLSSSALILWSALSSLLFNSHWALYFSYCIFQYSNFCFFFFFLNTEIKLIFQTIHKAPLCFLDMCIPSLEKCLCKPFAFLKTGLFLSLLLSCKSPLYILDTPSLSEIWFKNIFSYSIGCLNFFFLFCSLQYNNLKFDELQFLYVFLLVLVFGAIPKKLSPNPRSQSFMPTFSSKVLGLKFVFLIHFAIFCYYLTS